MGTGAITPGAVPPRPVGSRRRGGEQAATVCWSPAFRKQEDREIFLQLAASMPVLALGTHIAEAGDLSSREEAGAYVLYSFLQAVMTAEIKKVIASIEGELTPYKANYRRGYSPLTELWWNSLLTGSRDIPVQGTQAEVTELLATVNETAGSEVPHSETVEAQSGQIGLGLRLEPPGDHSETWRLTFWAENKEEGEFWIPAQSIWNSKEREFTLWGKHYRNIQQQLLMALGRAAKISPDIQHSLTMPAPSGADRKSVV